MLICDYDEQQETLPNYKRERPGKSMQMSK